MRNAKNLRQIQHLICFQQTIAALAIVRTNSNPTVTSQRIPVSNPTYLYKHLYHNALTAWNITLLHYLLLTHIFSYSIQLQPRIESNVKATSDNSSIAH